MRVVDDLERKGACPAQGRPGGTGVPARWRSPPRASRLYDAAHVAAEPLVEHLVAGLAPGEAEQLTGLLTRFTYPADTAG